MIKIIHDDNNVIKVLRNEIPLDITTHKNKSITTSLLIIAKNYPNALIIWCHKDYQNNINEQSLISIFHHKKILASYNPQNIEYLPRQIGYVEYSYYLKIKKDVTYPTWQMSSCVGGIYADVINHLKDDINLKDEFDYFLISLAKRAMTEGLFCYSEPKLIIKKDGNNDTPRKTASNNELFKFVKEHYKWFWVFFLSICFIIYEKRLSSILLLFSSLFYKRRNSLSNLEKINVKSNRKFTIEKEVDVIIPTIGRKKYLYQVLKDLSKQTILPKNVIIIEQNPNHGATSNLDYLTNQEWPFHIKHKFTNQAGVCNARNLALKKLESEWCFFADDDIRFRNDLIENSFNKIQTYGISVLNFLCLQEHQKQDNFKLAQTTIFGSGCSFVKTSTIEVLKFDMAYEFGFGEDSDFGMQIREKGGDVIFIPDIKVTHLKAPIGGFRTKINQKWDNDIIQPKPSPTIYHLHEKYFTDYQLKGYKLSLSLRYYKSQNIKNPFKYIKYFNKQWGRSKYWSSRLIQ